MHRLLLLRLLFDRTGFVTNKQCSELFFKAIFYLFWNHDFVLSVFSEHFRDQEFLVFFTVTFGFHLGSLNHFLLVYLLLEKVESIQYALITIMGVGG